MAEGARLESVCAGNRTEGSNPSLSAKQSPAYTAGFCLVQGVEPVQVSGANEGFGGAKPRTEACFEHG